MAELFSDLTERPLKDTVCLFDVDGTLSPARLHASPEMLQTLAALRHKCAIGFVGGSNLVKQEEQLGTPSISVISLFDYAFAENGLTAYRQGKPLASQSFIKWLGQEKYQRLARWLLQYISKIEGIPKMTGTFIEFRNGMINVSPVGRNASKEERDEYEAWDKKTNTRANMIAALKTEFPDYGLTYSIGGQISFDVFPHGWDKTYCLQYIEGEKDISGIEFKNIHFFGDKAFEGGNDWEIYSDPRTIGHAVKNPEDTIRILKETFGV